MNNSTILFGCIVAYLLLMNIWAWAWYGKDKRKAQTSKSRISERALLTLAWLGGGVGAWIGMHHFRHKTLHWKFRLCVPLACLIWLFPSVSIITVYALHSGPIWFTPLMIRRAMEAENPKTHTTDYRWVDYASISPSLTRAVIASEDNLFATHHGFSESGLRKAWQEYREKNKVRHGGSTISQQTAKNVFTTGKRTYWRKVRETWYTIWIETFWSKQRIMEVYLNVIEMGNGIYGAEAASQAYFHHTAAHLTPNESALIAACLPNPRVYSVTHPGPYMRKRQGQILNLMPKMGAINLSNGE